MKKNIFLVAIISLMANGCAIMVKKDPMKIYQISIENLQTPLKLRQEDEKEVVIRIKTAKLLGETRENSIILIIGKEIGDEIISLDSSGTINIRTTVMRNGWHKVISIDATK
jgi:hypothetical protein